ncbi:MAG: hypothetical protein ACRDPC_05720 [Solirubrobacteraceae bacterium]
MVVALTDGAETAHLSGERRAEVEGEVVARLEERERRSRSGRC